MLVFMTSHSLKYMALGQKTHGLSLSLAESVGDQTTDAAEPVD